MLRALGILALIAATVVNGQSSRVQVVKCDTSTACFPWSTRGPYCGRGASMNLRYQLQLTSFNFIPDSTVVGGYITNVTYAFCPRVDELQAFNITMVGELAYTYLNQSTGNVEWMNENNRFLSVIGFGDTNNVNFPQEGSAGRVMVADFYGNDLNDTPQCPGDDVIAVVPFLILNVTLDKGRFMYYDGYTQPAGVGFAPSCDKFDVCLLDSKMFCVGEVGNRNCAECVTKDVARSRNVQVWVSYYGTDASGRQLRSGANNPLNFQAFSGSGVSSSMRRSFNNIQNGELDSADGLEPQ